MRNKTIWLPVCAIAAAALILFGASAALNPLRAANARAELDSALRSVLPGAAEFTPQAYAGEDDNISKIYRTENGYVVETCTNGYAGPITMLVGVNNEGVVTGAQVRDMHETPGLGARAKNDAAFLGQLRNSRGDLEVGENVDAISGATVTSKAIARSVNSASAFVTGADVTSSATTWGG